MKRMVRDESGAWLLLKNAVVRATPSARSSFAGFAAGWRKTASVRPERSTMAIVAVLTFSADAAALTIALISALERAANGCGPTSPMAPSLQSCGPGRMMSQPPASTGGVAFSSCAETRRADNSSAITIAFLPITLTSNLVDECGLAIGQNQRIAALPPHFGDPFGPFLTEEGAVRRTLVDRPTLP